MTPDDHGTTAALLSVTGSLIPVPCPKCGGALARRVHREGMTEKMMSLLYVYPFRCQSCDHRFLSLQWGIRYHRIAAVRRTMDRRLAGVPDRLSGTDRGGTGPRPGPPRSLA